MFWSQIILSEIPFGLLFNNNYTIHIHKIDRYYIAQEKKQVYLKQQTSIIFPGQIQK